MKTKNLFLCVLLCQLVNPALATQSATVTYLGNTALLVDHDATKVMFDPFFHNHFGQYQLVPEPLRTAIFAGDGAFSDVAVILISHAHGDHFDAPDLLRYLQRFPNTQLVAPSQAIHEIEVLADHDQVAGQIHPLDLARGDAPVSVSLGSVLIEAVRIPHAGWPQRAQVANLVYRVTLNDQITVMHMGDADPDDAHFKQWQEHWQARVTDQAYPPYWFMLTPSGQQILTERINTKSAIGVHVPEPTPAALQDLSQKIFNQPGQTLTIQPIQTQESKPHE